MIKKCLAIGALLSMFFGAYLYIDSWKADAEDLKLVEQRLDQKILTDRKYEIKDRIYVLEERHGVGCIECSQTIKEEYRELQDDLEEVEEAIKDKK